MSHELNKIEVIPYDSLTSLIPQKELQDFRSRGMTPTNPHARACNTGSDIFFQGSEAINKFYDAVPGIVESIKKHVSAITGRPHSLFEYAGPAYPHHVIITMGSSYNTVKEVVDLTHSGHGVINVRLFRP